MPIRTHRHALGESRATVAALYPAGRGVRGGGGIPNVWDYRHVSGAGGFSIGVTEPTGLSPATTSSGYTTSSVWTANTLYATSFFVGGLGAKVTSLGIPLVTASGTPSTAYLGIYKCAPPSARNIYPTSLVYDFGTVTLNGVPANTQRNTSAPPQPVKLAPGLYWSVYKHVSGTPILPYRENTMNDTMVPGTILVGGTPYFTNGISVPGAAGPLEAVFPAGGTLALSARYPIVSINFGV